MNNETFDPVVLQEQFDISLAVLKSNVAAYVCWLVAGSINIIFSFLTVLIIFQWKPLHSDTQFLAGNLAVSEMGISAVTISLAIRRLYNIYNKIPESMSKNECFVKTVWLYFFAFLQSMFLLVLSCDRFYATIFPMNYLNRNKYYKLILAIGVWSVAIILTLLLYLDVVKQEMVPICFTKYLFGAILLKVSTAFSLCFSLISAIVYVVCLIVLKLQVSKTRRIGGSIAGIRIQMRNKVTQSLSLIVFLHLFIHTLSAVWSLLIAYFDTGLGNLNPYFLVLYCFGGISSFGACYIRQQQFREGFQFLFRTRLK